MRTIGSIRPSSSDGSVDTVVPFSHSTPSPLVLQALAPGQTLARVAILIQTPFDAPGASLSVGTFADPAKILAPGDAPPAASGQYESDAIAPTGVPDSLILTISPSGSTVGAGLLYYRTR